MHMVWKSENLGPISRADYGKRGPTLRISMCSVTIDVSIIRVCLCVIFTVWFITVCNFVSINVFKQDSKPIEVIFNDDILNEKTTLGDSKYSKYRFI